MALSDYGPGGIAADYMQTVKGQRGKRELAESVEAGTAGMSEAEKRQRRGLGEAAAVRAGQAAVEDAAGLQSPGQQTKSMMAIGKEASAPMLIALCWVAREVLPGQWRDCRTYILFRAPSWFRLWYAKNGEETAEWLHAHPWAKPLVRPLFRYFAWRGKRMAQKNPYFIEIQSRLA